MKTFLLLAAVAGVVSTIHAADRPNIIVFYTDDHGHADLSCQGVVADVKTPHIDALAASGVRAVNGYSTAPQCVPSRAGLMVGRFQNRFGVESNPDPLDGFNRETTLAERLQAQGYVTAQFGKWHLGPPHEISQHGFRHVFSQNAQRPFFANINDEGQDIPPVELLPGRYHLDACARAAAAVIERYQDEPFFLYVAFRAPHTPLDAPPEYVERFPGPMPERRRQALAMISAVDDGVGRVMETLARCGLTEKTLIFLIGDNGAPLKIHKIDSPVKGDPGGWDGSLNDPLNGEKGMLSEGGMHVPFVVAWPGVIPGRQVYPHAVSALDVAATAVEIAGLGEAQGLGLDGVNLVPFLTGQKAGPPHETLYWRWIAQSAIREGDWKLLRGGEREYLYNLAEDLEEKHNLASQEPERVARLREKLVAWSAQLSPAGLTTGEMSPVWEEYFDVYLEGKPATEAPTRGERRSMQWVARNGELKQADGEFWIDPDSSGRLPFLAVTGFKAQGPVTLVLRLKSDEKGEVG
ncbi:MAG: sulfatase-like hydrolase/transferase, partial [Verrucomicrobiales bacterium]|nr:sulfatase-like hydrolase/transferase [Verrucomicrobiales bacterium]